MTNNSTAGTRSNKRLWILAIVLNALALSLICLCCWAFLSSAGVLGLPTVKSLVRRYLEAVTAGDVETAVSLGSGQCGGGLSEDVRADIAELSGSEIRNLVIDVRGNSGSDDELRFAYVSFEYRRPGQAEWMIGEMRFASDAQVSIVDIRHLCPMR